MSVSLIKPQPAPRRTMPRDRLAYLTTGQADVTARRISLPAPLEVGEVLGRFMSATICATDWSNAHGILGHQIGADAPQILGHECCYEIVESRNPLVPVGSFMVTLGDDWHGFTEYEKFWPVLPSTDPAAIPLEFSARATYFDPIPGVKAACVFKEWFSGASLIEPNTHVLTAYLYSQRLTFARRVVVLGGGYCGQMACITAKMFGAERVTVLDINPERIDFAVSQGFADEGFDPRYEAAIEALISRTDGAYADVVFDALPGMSATFPDTRSLGARLLRPGGVWMLYAAAHSMTMPTITLLAKGIRVLGAPYDSRTINFRQRASLMGMVHGLIRSERIPVEPFISRWISLSDTRAVSEAILNYGRSSDIKVEIRR